MSAKDTWSLACPNCGTGLGTLPVPGDAVSCPDCQQVYGCIDGIWRFLPPDRLADFSPFLQDYTRIRLAEGRGSEDRTYYLNLPDCPPDHPIAWQWQIRRRTFTTLCRRVLPRLGTQLQVLDLGAGVGWLSHRLAALGHRPCAIDLSVDDRDGLGAARHYNPPWPRLQAEFDHLPLAPESVDVVLYNASVHYSTDYHVTLREARRVLRSDGHIVILESPIYKREESGQQMVATRHADFEHRFGTRSDTLPSIEYLTWDRLEALARDLDLTWQSFTPWYGWNWAMRPWKARLRGQREPSRFTILVA